MNCCHLLVIFITPSILEIFIEMKNIRAVHTIIFPFTHNLANTKPFHFFFFSNAIVEIMLKLLRQRLKVFHQHILCAEAVMYFVVLGWVCGLFLF